MRIIQAMEMSFKKTDIIGPSYSLEHEGETSFKSAHGGIISSIVMMFITVAAFIFGLDLIDKRNPYLSTTKVQQQISSISLYKFPIIFSIYTKELENVVNFDEYVTFQIDQVIGPFTIDEGTYNNPDKYPLKKCNISEQYDFYKNASYPGISLYCPDFPANTTLQNEYLSSNSTSYIFNFFKCNPTQRKCADDLDVIFETLSLYVAFVDSSLEPQNYLNPFEKIEIARGFQLSNTLQKTIRISINSNSIISDIGWIFNDLVIQEYVKINSFDVEYSIISEHNEGYNTQFIINSPAEVTIIQRNYVKVQEIFAKVGGVLNALFIIAKLLFSDFLRFKYHQFIQSMFIEKSAHPSANPAAISTYNTINVNNVKLNDQGFNKFPIKNNFMKDSANAFEEKKEEVSINPEIKRFATFTQEAITSCLTRNDYLRREDLVYTGGYMGFVIGRVSSAFCCKRKKKIGFWLSQKVMSLSTYMYSLANICSINVN